MQQFMLQRNNGCRSVIPFLVALSLSSLFHQKSASASAVAPTLAMRMGSKARQSGPKHADLSAVATTMEDTASSAVVANESAVPENATSEVPPAPAASSANPVVMLVTYLKDSVVNFKNGLGQMNSDHRRCNDIRTKQRTYAKNNGFARPRGLKGLQTGGISYEEYDFLKKGLVDRNKLLTVTVVMLCLPNYFVYYLWSFPDMLPSPFLKPKDVREISRERCHAVISTLLDIEKGARVAPFMSKLNPFGKQATDRAMQRLGSIGEYAAAIFEEDAAAGPEGGKVVLEKLKNEIYTAEPPNKQRTLLTGKIIPKQITKGLGKVISSDPLTKGSAPFGASLIKHVETLTLADEFLVNHNIDINSISSDLLAEACSARLIGGPGWTDEERKEALYHWLEQTEVEPRKKISNGGVYFNGNFARVALMGYNALDSVRDARSDSRLLRLLYQGQMKEPVIA